MPTIKRIVCLANSRKRGGRCIAGKELRPDGTAGAWLRPVSDRADEEASPQERCYANGADPQVLDIIDIPLLRQHPKTYQQENWLLDPNRRWNNMGRATWDDLDAMADLDAPLWVNGHTTRDGQNDRIPLGDTTAIDNSLRLIKVATLTVTVTEPLRPSADFPVLRGSFSYGADEYRFRITDPVSESGSVNLRFGDYPVGERYLVISLGEPYEGYAYKLIATIIRP